ncbi:DUF4168 domain-containing protein [Sediminimonas qiaohouensis]|uniref:DUF4168 domain-containing protein n=1 Tax=Sediminimonas qiaohouensis TaxID=552061 RepID=UPI0003F84ED7|nr:DUF4168 domain-containing protein [Sediminimonas qiaohouensis]
MTFKTTLAATTTAVALAFAGPVAVMAQDEDQAAKKMEASDVTDAKVSAFVEALVAVDAVRKDFAPKIEAEQDEEAKQELVNEANAAIVDAVDTTEGMTVDEYTSIVELAQADQALNQKIMDEIKTLKE